MFTFSHNVRALFFKGPQHNFYTPTTRYKYRFDSYQCKSSVVKCGVRNSVGYIFLTVIPLHRHITKQRRFNINKLNDLLRASKLLQKRKQGYQKQLGINPGLMRNVQNQLIRENRPNYFGYKIQTKLQKILAMLGAIPVECSGKRSVIT